MITHGSVAAKVRAEKENHPERFCPVKGCLWRTVTNRGSNPCRKHALLKRYAPDLHAIGCDMGEDCTCKGVPR